MTEMCTHLVKMLPWLKDEMQKSEAVCVASKLLMKADEDIREEIVLCGIRRLAVDKLLKFVLRKNGCYLKKFFSILKEHNPTDLLYSTIEVSRPTELEVKGLVICFRNIIYFNPELIKISSS